MAKKQTVTVRQRVRALAATSGLPLSEVDRAIVLGQIAELLAKSPRVGTKIAFKGAAVMRLVEKSPRLSRDLDSSLIMHTGRRVTLEDVEAALSTDEARKIVKRVDRKSVSSESTQLRIPVIVCLPKSGIDEVQVSFSVNWSEPILLETVVEDVEVEGKPVRLRVMARPERIAEKVRTYLNRGEHRDVFDLYLYATRWMTRGDWGQLADLVERKLLADPKASKGDQARAAFDRNTAALAVGWDDPKNPLRLLSAEVPVWKQVGPVLAKFRARLPGTDAAPTD